MKRWVIFSSLICAVSTWSEPVWHCSKNTSESALSATAPQLQSNQFSIASFNASNDVIGVSLNDLIDIYSGIPVRVGGVPLSACFMPNNHALTIGALTSLGLEPSAIQALARKSSINQSNLFFVTNETQMLSCIGQHFPAVGYLNEPTNSDVAFPCF